MDDIIHIPYDNSYNLVYGMAIIAIQPDSNNRPFGQTMFTQSAICRKFII